MSFIYVVTNGMISFFLMTDKHFIVYPYRIFFRTFKLFSYLGLEKEMATHSSIREFHGQRSLACSPRGHKSQT